MIVHAVWAEWAEWTTEYTQQHGSQFSESRRRPKCPQQVSSFRCVLPEQNERSEGVTRLNIPRIQGIEQGVSTKTVVPGSNVDGPIVFSPVKRGLLIPGTFRHSRTVRGAVTR